MSTKNKPSPLGANVLRLRTQKAMTQQALAHAIGHRGSEAGSYISRIERSKYEPRLPRLRKIAAALGVSLEKLVSPK